MTELLNQIQIENVSINKIDIEYFVSQLKIETETFISDYHLCTNKKVLKAL